MKDHLTQESNPIVIGLTLCTKRYIKIKVYCGRAAAIPLTRRKDRRVNNGETVSE